MRCLNKRSCRPGRRAFTLIELLIVVAILTILSAGAANMMMALEQARVRESGWRDAVALADDAIALLRARPALPPPGRHPIDPELHKLHFTAPEGEVEIRPGPNDRLREVRVTVRLRDGAQPRDVVLAALLPAAAEEVKP